MSVEVECYSVKRQREDILEQSVSVAPGSLAPISFLDNIRLVTFCDDSNTAGSIWIGGKNPERYVSVILYENEDDDEGRPVFVDPDLPVVRITAEQELYIYSRKKPKKEVFVCLESDDDEDEEIMTDSPEDSKFLVPV